MNRRIATGRWILATTLAVAGLGLSPSHAEDPPSKIWQGTIALPKVTSVDHESVQYVQEGCAVDHPDGMFSALIDVSDYQGRVLRFTGNGSELGTSEQPGWVVYMGTVCGPVSPGGQATTPQGPTQWTNTSPFVLIYVSLPPAYNARYTLEVLPES